MMKEVRSASELTLVKKLSQRLMRDCNIGYSFAEAVAGLGSNNVIEVGSGIGFLTRFISRAVKQVIAVELDLRFIPYLKRYLRDLQNVYVVAGDGEVLLNGCRLDTLVSNTPYHISGPLLADFVKSNLKFAVLMLQKEVAERLISKPGEHGYSRITAFLNTFTSISRIKEFPPSSFFPEPKVNSTLVVIVKKKYWNASWRTYEDMLRFIFTQRRKLAKKVFKTYIKGLKISVLEEELNFLNNKRVFELSTDELIQVHKLINKAFIKNQQA